MLLANASPSDVDVYCGACRTDLGLPDIEKAAPKPPGQFGTKGGALPGPADSKGPVSTLRLPGDPQPSAEWGAILPARRSN
jgi:hypothetical protein